MIDVDQIAEALESGRELTAQERAAAAAALRQAQTRPAVLAVSNFAERDQLVVECWRKFYGARSVRDGSEEMAAALGRYFATPWLRDRRAVECPRRAVGTPQGAFWLILQAVPRALSPDRIRKIVGQFEVPQSTRQGVCEIGAQKCSPTSA